MWTTPDLSTIEQVKLLLMAGVTCFWFFAVGTVFGSFLNVVIYRMPRGLSVGGSSSHCPGCERSIPWYDNVPILGYLRLKGRCQCRDNAISPRYPLVETVVGLIVIALLIVELLSGGANLPVRRPMGPSGVVWVIWSLQWDLIGTYFYHLALLYVLLGLSLIDFDGFAPPWKWVCFGLAVGLIAPLAAPFLQMVPIRGGSTNDLAGGVGVIDASARAVIGLAAGGVLGFVAAWPWRHERSMPNASAHLVWALALAGLFLGWQSAFSIALAASMLLLILRRASLDEPDWAKIPPSIVVWVLVFVQILCWRGLASSTVWPGPSAISPALVASLVTLLGTTWLASRIRLPESPTNDERPGWPAASPLVEIRPMPEANDVSRDAIP